MTLNEFVKELKHRSTYINVFYNAKIMFLGTVGEYSTAVIKDKIGSIPIAKIEPLTAGNLNIFLNVGQ